MDHLYKWAFPNISGVLDKKTSDATDYYNCIAWAFGHNTRRWWPNTPGYVWPLNARGLSDSEAFDAWFAHDGWEVSDSVAVELGLAKIALYAINGAPKHAARQLPNGMWTSKLGPDIDLFHELFELEGPQYGVVERILKKTTFPIASLLPP